MMTTTKEQAILQSEADITTIRIIRDSQNKDGWTARKLSDSKLCFIKNLDLVISTIEAGQIWEATIEEEKPKFDIITLVHCIKH